MEYKQLPKFFLLELYIIAKSFDPAWLEGDASYMLVNSWQMLIKEIMRLFEDAIINIRGRRRNRCCSWSRPLFRLINRWVWFCLLFHWLEELLFASEKCWSDFFQGYFEFYVKFACVWLLQYWFHLDVGYAGQISLNSRIDVSHKFMDYMEKQIMGIQEAQRGSGFRHARLTNHYELVSNGHQKLCVFSKI